MDEFQRGRVTRVTLEVEYPDGSTATSEVTDTHGLQAIIFTGDRVSSAAAGEYNVSPDDWKKNPAVALEYSSRVSMFCSKDSHCET